MVEKAFKVKHGSKFEKMYFRSEKALDDWGHNAMRFAEKLVGFNGAVLLGDRLTVKLSDDGKSEYADQLMKKEYEGGYSVFKKNSPIQKEYYSEVVVKADWRAMNWGRWWAEKCFEWGGSIRMRRKLWEYNGTVYGYLAAVDNDYAIIKLLDDMEEIKMSEYYAVIEEMEAHNHD